MRQRILILGHNDATQFIDIYNQYSELFDKKYYEVTVAFLTGKPSDTVRQRTLAEQVIFLEASKKDTRGLKVDITRRLLALCREKNFQVVICHRFKPTYMMLLVNLRHRIPALICVMHELGTMASFRRQCFIAALARKNVLFAGVSNAVRDDMRRDLWAVPNERIITLYNMIDVSLTEPHLLSAEEARQALNLDKQAFVFGQVARLATNKNQVSLINAFAAIKPQCPNAKLIILGDGELESALKQQIADLGLQHDVVLTGFIANGFKYMKAFDCFVLSSIQEAFGRVLLEAMIAKRPIIATRVNGIPEVLGNTGTLLQANDTNALAAAMLQIYQADTNTREQQADAGYDRAVQQFSIPVFQQQFWQLPLIQSLKDTACA